ncbi:MAG TPA: glycosyltransferase family protein [Candidatus Binatia bacterium]|nr:glycosyltransferase family protein [Candidatus Binatia bacterium]
MRRPIAIVQARMASSRLPGKVLEDLAGAPLLARIVERLRAARTLGGIAVATTDRPEDKPIRFLAQVMHIGCFVGSDWDVLARYAGAAEQFEADPVIRILGDCPLVDPELVDACVAAYRSVPATAYVALGGEFPEGLDTEVVSARALRRAHLEAALPAEREDVTPFIRRHPERFPSRLVPFPEPFGRRRWTVDDRRDLEFVRAVYGRLHRPGEVFGWRAVRDLLLREPELLAPDAGGARVSGRSPARDAGKEVR